MPGATTCLGCVGKDHYAAELQKVASKDGVQVGPGCHFLFEVPRCVLFWENEMAT